MIISKLQGGLGNQMFQFAAGYALAKKLKTKLSVDITDYDKPEKQKRSLKLDKFPNINLKIVSREVSEELLRSHKYYWKGWLGKMIGLNSKYSIYTENQFSFEASLSSMPRNTYLLGYWQSYKYFNLISEGISWIFNFPSFPESSLTSRISEPGSVAIHVRRGDYANDIKTNSFHGVLPIDYYRNAVSFLKNKTHINTLFVFSDDINWAKENLRFTIPTEFVSNAKYNDIDEMQLMSLANHNVIANSSFSWWSAWLNNQNDRITIAPKNWFVDQQINVDDLLPPHWIRI